MTKEEIIELAIQVGIKRRTDEFYSEFCDGVYFDDLVTFAKLIAEKEREAIEKRVMELDETMATRVYVINKAIRERGQE